jgi:hypothetical protein
MKTGSVPADDAAPVPEPRTGRLNVSSLRRATPVRMWGGKGCGEPCDLCRVIVTASDVEYEVEAQLDGATVMLHFHPRCHDAWRAGQDPDYSPPAAG